MEVSETSTSRSGSRFRGTIKFTYTPTNPSTPLIEYIEGIHRISPLTTSQDKQNYRLKPLNRSSPPFTNLYIDNLVSNVTVYKYNDREGVEWNIIDGESANKGVLIIKMPFGDKAGIAMQWSAGSGKGIVNLWKIKHKDKITVKDLNLRQASIIGPKEYGYFDGRNGSVGIVESATHRYRGEMTPSFVYNGQGRMEDPNAGAVFEGRYEHGVAVSGRIYQQDKQIIELKGRKEPNSTTIIGRAVMQPGSLYDSDFNPLGPNDKKVPGKDYFVQLYEGEYMNLKKHGKGKITIPTGVTYEGEFEEDKAHGQGVLTFANGMYFFKGYFVNGVVDRTRPYQTSKGVNTGEDGEGVIIAQMIGLQDSFVSGISKENSSVNTTKQSATGSNVPPSQFTPKTPL